MDKRVQQLDRRKRVWGNIKPVKKRNTKVLIESLFEFYRYCWNPKVSLSEKIYINQIEGHLYLSPGDRGVLVQEFSNSSLIQTKFSKSPEKKQDPLETTHRVVT